MKESIISAKELYTQIDSTKDKDFLFFEKLDNKKIIVVKTKYHSLITSSIVFDFINNMEKGDKIKAGEFQKQLGIIDAPGCFELPLITKKILDAYSPKLILTVGCIIKGDTKHDEYLASTVINGIRNLSLQYNTPIINGILTTDNEQQAIDRAGKKYQKGMEFAESVKEMINIFDKFDKNEFS